MPKPRPLTKPRPAFQTSQQPRRRKYIPTPKWTGKGIIHILILSTDHKGQMSIARVHAILHLSTFYIFYHFTPLTR